MSSYASLVGQSASYRIALHHERKAHKRTRSQSRKILKVLEQQLDDKQAVLESIIERHAELESKFWKLINKCPALARENDDYYDDENDEDEDEEDDEEDAEGNEDDQSSENSEDQPYRYRQWK